MMVIHCTKEAEFCPITEWFNLNPTGCLSGNKRIGIYCRGKEHKGCDHKLRRQKLIPASRIKTGQRLHNLSSTSYGRHKMPDVECKMEAPGGDTNNHMRNGETGTVTLRSRQSDRQSQSDKQSQTQAGLKG